ncbi:hypothetical protein [Amycolatopsis sp. cmx-11-51]|uniref:LGFP repeat-containing protein n=1 Tax=Amycolatopsis sp. cmx-11-51 TaxID=2785797 RepID=UPI0039E23A68
MDEGNSVTAGIIYNGLSYPDENQGAFFFGDYVTQKIWTMTYDGQGRLAQAPEFIGIGGPVEFAANGDLVHADIHAYASEVVGATARLTVRGRQALLERRDRREADRGPDPGEVPRAGRAPDVRSARDRRDLHSGGIGRYNHFPNRPGTLRSSIYRTPPTGARPVDGRSRVKWAALGWETGPLGYRTTDESATPDGIGRYIHSTKADSIYRTMPTDSHAIYEAIRQRWAAPGWERPHPRYPATDGFTIPIGRRSSFQAGQITWNRSAGQVIDRRW